MFPPLAFLKQSFPVLIPLHANNNLNVITGKNFKATTIIIFNYIKENKLTMNQKRRDHKTEK